jgi:hypothetical protein
MRPSHSALRLSVPLLLGLACALAPAAAAEGTAQTGYHSLDLDLDLEALHVSTFTDTLPDQAAADFQARAGDPVRRVYLVRNDGLLPLVDVSVHDPDAAGAALSCGPDGAPDISALAPLSWASCSTSFTAETGGHSTTVTASATSPTFGRSLSATTVAGYTAVEPGLQVTVSFGSGVDLPANTDVPATVTITDTGSVTLHDLTPVSPQPLSGLSCGPGGSVLPDLGPGESALCTATLATTPGVHSGSLTLAGTWTWAQPITAAGLQCRRVLAIQAVADASYTGVLPPAPPPAQVRAAPPPPPRQTPPQQTRAAAVPPTPTPTPTASPPHSPSASPTPSRGVLVGNPQYPVSHGLSVPLKVLAIVIVPAIAVGRRAVGSIGRN